MSKSVVKLFGVALIAAGLSLAGVVAPAYAANSGTITVTSFQARMPTPAFTVTSNYSPRQTNGTGADVSLNLNQLLIPSTCPTALAGTTIWADCGVTSIKIDGSDVLPATTVRRFGSSKIVITLPAALGGITSSEISFAASALTASNTVGNTSAVFTWGDYSVSSSFSVTAAPNFTVTFDSNGGSGTMSDQTTNAVTALTANSFTRSGYTFGGWASSSANAAAGTVAYTNGADYDFLAATTLYAIWTANSSGGSGGSSTAATNTDLANTGSHALPNHLFGLTMMALGVIVVTSARRIKR